MNNYDPKKNVSGMTNAKRNYYIRLNNSLKGLLATEGAIIAAKNADTGTLEEAGTVKQTDYVNVGQVPNVRVLPLGTDNFGRDVTTELVSATRVSLDHWSCRGSHRNHDRSDPGIAGGLYRRHGG